MVSSSKSGGDGHAALFELPLEAANSYSRAVGSTFLGNRERSELLQREVDENHVKVR